MNRRNYSRNHFGPKRYTGENEQRPQKEYETSTHCESRYLQFLAKEVCEIVFVLRQGEQITGHLAWHDESCLKVRPSDGSPSLLISKGSLKYLYELSEVDTTR